MRGTTFATLRSGRGPALLLRALLGLLIAYIVTAPVVVAETVCIERKTSAERDGDRADPGLGSIRRLLARLEIEWAPEIREAEPIDRSDRGYLVAFRRAPRREPVDRRVEPCRAATRPSVPNPAAPPGEARASTPSEA